MYKLAYLPFLSFLKKTYSFHNELSKKMVFFYLQSIYLVQVEQNGAEIVWSVWTHRNKQNENKFHNQTIGSEVRTKILLKLNFMKKMQFAHSFELS
jgi:hypothetical protein